MSKKNRETQAPQATAAGAPSRWTDYFWANLIFFAFLFTLAWVVRMSCEGLGEEPTIKQAIDLVLDQTFHFLLLLLGGGFLLVTLFDAAYEHFSVRASQDQPAPGAAQA